MYIYKYTHIFPIFLKYIVYMMAYGNNDTTGQDCDHH